MGYPQREMGTALVESGLLARDIVDGLLRDMKPGDRLCQLVSARGLLSEERLTNRLAEHVGIDLVQPAKSPVHPRVLALVPQDRAAKYRIVPIARQKQQEREFLIVATANPFDREAYQEVKQLVPGEVEVQFVLASETEISRGLEMHYGLRLEELAPVTAPDDTIQERLPDTRSGGSLVAADLSSTEVVSAHPLNSLEDQTVKVAEASPPTPFVPKVDLTPSSPSSRGPTVKMNRSHSTTGLVRLGPYEIGPRLRVEGNAEIYPAQKKTQDGRAIEIRRMLPNVPKSDKSAERFFGAAARVVGMAHANVQEVFDVGRESKEWFVAVERIDGIDLARAIEALDAGDQRLPEQLALFIVTSALKGLEHAHRFSSVVDQDSVVHGFISPSSVYLTRVGEVKLREFGVVEMNVRDRQLYTSPEQLDKPEAVSVSSDVFRMGLVLYQLLTGESLFDGEGLDRERLERTVTKVESTMRGHCPDASEQLIDIVVRALGTQSSKRFRTSADFLGALDQERLRSTELRGAKDLATMVSALLDGKRALPGEPKRSALSANLAGPIRKAGEKVEEMVEIAAPAAKEIGFRGSEGVRSLVQRFSEWWGARSANVRLGLIAAPIAVIAGLVIGASVGGEDKPAPATEVAVDLSLPSALAETDLPDPEGEPVEPAKTTPRQILPGVFDDVAADGFAFVQRSASEVRATAAADGEVVFWLDRGQKVRKMGTVEGEVLVLVLPRGPTGFLSQKDLGDERPIGALADEIKFRRCGLTRRRSFDDCLVRAKRSLDRCATRCESHDSKVDHRTPPGSRCFQACTFAFNVCAESCEESKRLREEQAAKPRRRKRRRR